MFLKSIYISYYLSVLPNHLPFSYERIALLQDARELAISYWDRNVRLPCS